MSKKDLKALMQKNLARDTKGATERPRLEAVIAGAVHAPLDIAKPLAGLAREIDLDHIEPDPKQPRTSMDAQTLKDLADSIKENGVIQAITVTWSKDTGHYRIIAGHRRVEASKLAGLSSIPAIIKPDSFDERRRLQEQLVENLQRENLPPIDEARGVQTLMETEGLSQREAAKRLGKPLIYVSELTSILKIDPRRLKRAADLPKRALVEIGRAATPQDQDRLLEAALHAKSPVAELKRAKAERKETAASPRRETTFKAHYGLGDTTVILTIDTDPERVTPKYLIKILERLIDTIRAEERPRHGKGPPKR